MTPLDRLAEHFYERMTERGFRPLDRLDGRLGGERHGVWDITWIATPLLAPTCYASLYGWSGVQAEVAGMFFQVWAGIERPDESRSLVTQIHALVD